jgi:hypothetical protein
VKQPANAARKLREQREQEKASPTKSQIVKEAQVSEVGAVDETKAKEPNAAMKRSEKLEQEKASPQYIDGPVVSSSQPQNNEASKTTDDAMKHREKLEREKTSPQYIDGPVVSSSQPQNNEASKTADDAMKRREKLEREKTSPQYINGPVVSSVQAAPAISSQTDIQTMTDVKKVNDAKADNEQKVNDRSQPQTYGDAPVVEVNEMVKATGGPRSRRRKQEEKKAGKLQGEDKEKDEQPNDNITAPSSNRALRQARLEEESSDEEEDEQVAPGAFAVGEEGERRRLKASMPVTPTRASNTPENVAISEVPRNDGDDPERQSTGTSDHDANEEHSHSHKEAAAQEKWSKKTKVALLICIALVLVAIVIGVVVSLTSNSNEGGDDNKLSTPPASEQPTTVPNILAPTPAPTPAPTTLTAVIFAFYRELLEDVSSPEDLRDPNTPQYAALEWLATKDPMGSDVEEIPMPTLVERYLVVLLYYSTNGENWRSQRNFLSASSVCEWNDGIDIDNTVALGCGGDASTVFLGVSCGTDNKSSVNQIYLSK